MAGPLSQIVRKVGGKMVPTFGPADPSTAIAALQSAVAGKADAVAVSTALAGKADTTAVPVPSTAPPPAEAVTAAPGAMSPYARGDHVHPRLTSSTGNTAAAPTSHVIGSSGTATIAFTRSFTLPPAPVFTEVPPASSSMSAQPAIFRVESWTVSAGLYTGCTVRCWRTQTLPTLLTVTGILTAVITGINAIVSALTGFNPFGAPSTGTAFTCLAVQRSDAS